MSAEIFPFIPEYFKKSRAKTFIPEWIRSSESFTASLPKNIFVENRPLLLKGGNCIIPYKGIFPFDIRVQEGKIHSIGKNLSDKDAFALELQGKFIAPGIIDPHVHLGIFKDFDVEIVTETKSALLNGVTTLGLYIGGEEPYLDRLDDIVHKIEKNSFCDIFIHLVILNQKQLEEIPLYYSRYGIKSFKTYMCGIPGLIPEVEDDFLIQLMEKVAGLGNDAVLNIHAENYRLVNWATKKLKLAKPLSYSLEEWEKSHPGFAEAEAIQRASCLSMQTGAKVYFVHLSSNESIKIAKELREKNKNIYFETTSPYLTLDIQQDTDPLYKMVPPIRKKEDQDALWEGLSENIIDSIGSDHTPMSTREKKTGLSLWEILPGYPAVGTHLPSLLDGAWKHEFPVARLIEKTATSPARIFGLYSQKGTLLPGTDADLVIIDPILERVVTPQIAASRSDYCLHQGKKLRGWPVGVVKSGKLFTPETFDQAKSFLKGSYLPRS